MMRVGQELLSIGHADPVKDTRPVVPDPAAFLFLARMAPDSMHDTIGASPLERSPYHLSGGA